MKTYAAPDRNISTVLAFVELDRAAMRTAEAITIIANRCDIVSRALRMTSGPRRMTMTSQATSERVKLAWKSLDIRDIFGSREIVDRGYQIN